MPPAITGTSRVAIERGRTVADIWVLTQPTDGSKKRESIRANAITSVSGHIDSVLAVRPDTQDLRPSPRP
jgi:hypothetical protein